MSAHTTPSWPTDSPVRYLGKAGNYHHFSYGGVQSNAGFLSFHDAMREMGGRPLIGIIDTCPECGKEWPHRV